MDSTGRLHENLADRDEVRAGSERSFGIVFAVVFALIGLVPLISLRPPRLWALVTATGFALVAVLRPEWLAVPNRLWFRFGIMLHHIVNPIVLGVLFFAVIVPVAFALRIFKVKLLHLHYEPDSSSYWVKRTPPGPNPSSLKDQF